MTRRKLQASREVAPTVLDLALSAATLIGIALVSYYGQGAGL